MTNMKTVKFKGYFTVIRSDELEYLRQQEQLIKDINKKAKELSEILEC